MKWYIFLVIFSISASALAVDCNNINPRYNHTFHQASILGCNVPTAINCNNYLQNANSPIEEVILTEPIINQTNILKNLIEYNLEYGQSYSLEINCDSNSYQYNFTITYPDRFCYEVPYLSLNVCTPTLNDFGMLLEYGLARIDVYVVIPIFLIFLGIVIILPLKTWILALLF